VLVLGLPTVFAGVFEASFRRRRNHGSDLGHPP
jgi:hypothetical protein